MSVCLFVTIIMMFMLVFVCDNLDLALQKLTLCFLSLFFFSTVGLGTEGRKDIWTLRRIMGGGVGGWGVGSGGYFSTGS